MTIRIRASLPMLVVAVLASFLGAVPSAAQGPERCDKHCQGELERARDATERYWDVNRAVAHGYVELPGCEGSPGGAAGIKYTNFAQTADQHVGIGQPESLLYVPESLGVTGRRLVAVEYSVPVLNEGQDPPELFGRRFDGPVEDPGLGLRRYRLRVWLFSDNPSGRFAQANPAEACNAEGMIALHGALFGCHEVAVLGLSAPAKHVREIGSIPEDFRLLGEDEEGKGDTPLFVGAFSCDRALLEDGTAIRGVLISELTANLQPPDWEGGLSCACRPELGGGRYALRFFVNDRDVAKSWRGGTGIGRDVIAYSADLERIFDPVVGMSGAYSFLSPDFELRATVTDSPSARQPLFLRIWGQGRRGMGRFHFWVDNLGFGAAQVEVTPTPGGLLAKLVGCEPDPDSDSCRPIHTTGLVPTFDAAPYRMTVQREWWNPRQDGPKLLDLGS